MDASIRCDRAELPTVIGGVLAGGVVSVAVRTRLASPELENGRVVLCALANTRSFVLRRTVPFQC
jgi:hypothetical protein